jgi:hypothetical protein
MGERGKSVLSDIKTVFLLVFMYIYAGKGKDNQFINL